MTCGFALPISTNARVTSLLEHHAVTAREQTAAGGAYALDLHAFASRDLSLWAIWNNDKGPLGVGALNGALANAERGQGYACKPSRSSPWAVRWCCATRVSHHGERFANGWHP